MGWPSGNLPPPFSAPHPGPLSRRVRGEKWVAADSPAARRRSGEASGAKVLAASRRRLCLVGLLPGEFGL